ncbi:MAG: SPOR domain-containing protein [Terracidiphilus sp.]
MNITFAFQRPGMDDDFNPEEFRPAFYRPDTVLTLSPMMLVGLFFVLLLLCGLCFGVGYSMGSRSAHNSPPTGQQPGAGTASQASGSHSKPSAVQQKTPDVKSMVNNLSAVDTSGGNPGAGSQNPNPDFAAGANSTQPLVKPALPDMASALMIQIAIVSSQDDADVLVGALSKRGYTTTVSHDATSGQFHVRIGPFSNRSDAEAMRKKLIYDGYNAVVQP